MKYIRTIVRGLTVIGGIVITGAAASAQTVTYTYTGETQGGVNMNINIPGYAGQVLVGEYNMSTSDAGFPSMLKTYCTDVGATMLSPYTYTETPLSSATGVNPAWIAGGMHNASTIWANDKGAATTDIQTAGLQLAIWEALYNNLSGGGFTASSFANSANHGFQITSTDVKTVAAENYAAGLLNNAGSLPAVQDVVWLQPTPENNGSVDVQGLLLETPSAPVPEVTSTFGLLAMGMAIIGFIAKRSQRIA